MISAKQFSFQIDESVDVQNNVPLMVFIRYRNPIDYFEEILFFFFFVCVNPFL